MLDFDLTFAIVFIEPLKHKILLKKIITSVKNMETTGVN